MQLGYLVPHPPNLLESEQEGERLETIDALEAAGREIREAGIDVLLVASAHWQTAGPFFIDASERHHSLTDYFGFSVEVDYECPGDPDLAKALMSQAGESDLMADCVWGRGIDHGVSVPLHFMIPEMDIPVVPLSVSTRPPEECIAWGQTLSKTLDSHGRKGAFIASSSVSHRMPEIARPQAASRYRQFEDMVIGAMKNGSTQELLEIDSELIEDAEPEGGLRDVLALMGAVGESATGSLMSYESFYGLGFATMRLAAE